MITYTCEKCGARIESKKGQVYFVGSEPRCERCYRMELAIIIPPDEITALRSRVKELQADLSTAREGLSEMEQMLDEMDRVRTANGKNDYAVRQVRDKATQALGKITHD